MSQQEIRTRIFLILLEKGDADLIEEYYELAKTYSQKLTISEIEKAQA